jgi:hypothetical protein
MARPGAVCMGAGALRQRKRRRNTARMGIDPNLAYLLQAAAGAHPPPPGPVVTLGVQTLRGAPDPFVAMGLGPVESIDVSDFEGCTHLFDLNATELPPGLRERYSLVYDGGTLEHVFDTRAALGNIFGLLRTDGVVVHASPVNGWVEHGFYQFSPTFFVDYYHANGWVPLGAFLLKLQGGGRVTVHPYVPGMWDALPAGAITGLWLGLTVFRKAPGARWDAVPQQSLYCKIYGDPSSTPTEAGLAYAPPFELADGVVVAEDRVMRPLPPPRPGVGHEWHAHLPELERLADTSEGRLSPLLLFEDGRPLGPPHAAHEAIRTRGRGLYSHWGAWLHFSTSDNAPPGDRIYTYALPRPP